MKEVNGKNLKVTTYNVSSSEIINIISQLTLKAKYAAVVGLFPMSPVSCLFYYFMKGQS